MKRVERSGSIIYLDRRRGWSLLFLVSCVIGLVIGWDFLLRRDQGCAGLMLAGAAALGLTSVGLLFRARAFIIDPAARTLTVRDRRPLQSVEEVTHPLEKLEVLLESNQITHRYTGRYGGSGTKVVVTQRIWILVRGADRIVFMKAVRALGGQELARELAGDLGCKWVQRGQAV